MVVAVGETEAVPEVALEVVKLPVQDAALAEFQDKVEAVPLVIVAGLALKDTVGGLELGP